MVVLTVLVSIGLSVSVNAGNTGNQSVASIGVSLRIPSSIRARQVSASKRDTPPVGSNQEYLCLDMNKAQKVSLYVMTYNADGSQAMPVSHWSSDAQQTGSHRDQPINCGVSVPLKLPATVQSNDRLITLIISPE